MIKMQQQTKHTTCYVSCKKRLSNEGALLPLDDLLSAEVKADISPVLMNECTYTSSDAWRKGIEDYLKFYTEGLTPEGSVAMDGATLKANIQMLINGEGTVVVRPQILQELRSIYSFDEDMRRLGKNPETKIMDFVKIVPTGNVAAMMQLPMEAQMLHTGQGALGMLIERISYENGRVVEISKSVSPASKFKHHVVLRR